MGGWVAYSYYLDGKRIGAVWYRIYIVINVSLDNPSSRVKVNVLRVSLPSSSPEPPSSYCVSHPSPKPSTHPNIQSCPGSLSILSITPLTPTYLKVNLSNSIHLLCSPSEPISTPRSLPY
jgi:hypothetical protein